MKIERYHLKSDNRLTYFEFISIGLNGAVRKMIEFQATSTPGIYNLAFGDKNPEAIVYATGNTPARTRLYRMGITKFYNEIQNDFYVHGQIGDKLYNFEVGKEYQGFVAQRKFE